MKNVITVVDELRSIPLVADTLYIVRNNTSTHIVFNMPENPKVGDRYEIKGELGPQKCSWILEFNKPASIMFDDSVTAKERIIGNADDNLIMDCISIGSELSFHARSLKGNLSIDGVTYAGS